MIPLSKPISEMSLNEVMEELTKEVKRLVWENQELKNENKTIIDPKEI